jgi:hypothetical protein
MTMAMRSCCMLAAAAALAALVAVAPARAERESNPHLARAQEALAALEYEAALHALEKALLSGKNGPGGLQMVYRLLGEVRGSLGAPAEAEQQFRRLLALDVDAGLSDGVSPKILAPFSAALKYMRTRGTLGARCTVDEASASATVHVDTDPLSMATGARVIYRSAAGRERVLEAHGSSPMVLDLPATGRVELVCAVIDEHGNRLAEIGTWDDPLVMVAPARSALVPSSGSKARAPSRPLLARWYVWAPLSMAAAGAGGYFGLEARADQAELDRLNRTSMDHRFSEAEEVERRGKRNALLANIGFGTAGVLAVVTAITWGLRPDSPPRETSASIAPVPLRRGAGVSLQLSF